MAGVTQYIIILLLISILVASRNINKLFLQGGVEDADGYFHMVIAREFRENKHTIPDTISNSLFHWEYIYPPILHYLLSFIPKKYYEFIDDVLPTVMDVLYVCLLSVLIPLNILTVDEFTIVLILFITTPQFIQHSAAKGISARKLGILFGTLSLLSFYLLTMTGWAWMIFVSAVFAGLTHLTSRFGTQALVFLYTAFSFFYPISFIVVLFSFIFAIILSKGYYIDVLRAHILFSYDYAIRKQFTFLHDGLKSVDTFQRLVTARNLSDIASAIYESVLIKLLLNNPHTTVAFIFLLWGQQIDSFYVSLELVIWFGSGLVMTVLTTCYGLRFLGQPGRYLNFIFVPTTLIIVEFRHVLPTEFLLFSTIAAIVGLIMITSQIVAYERFKSSDEQKKQFNQAIEYITDNNINRIISQPRHIGSKIAWKVPECSISDYFGDSSSQSGIEQAKDLFNKGAYITSDLRTLEQFNPECVIFDKSKVSEEADNSVLLPPSTEPTFENEYYSIYEWKSFKSGK